MGGDTNGRRLEGVEDLGWGEGRRGDWRCNAASSPVISPTAAFRLCATPWLRTHKSGPGLRLERGSDVLQSAVPKTVPRILPPDALQAVASAACASKTLQQFSESLELYPGDVDPAESERLDTSLRSELEKALAHEVFAGSEIGWTPTSSLDAIFLACISLSAASLKVDLDFADRARLASAVDRTFSGLLSHMSPGLRKIVERVVEIMTVDMKIPAPTDRSEYRDARRAIPLFGKYWEAYGDILAQFGSSYVVSQPHAMSTTIAQLQYRLRECAVRIGDDQLTALLEDVLRIRFDTDTLNWFQEFAQPKINALTLVWEELRVLRRSRPFALTAAEKLFLESASAELEQLRTTSNAGWEAKLPKPEPVCESGDAESPPSRQIHLTARRQSKNYFVEIGPCTARVGDVTLSRFVRLLRGRYRTPDGWLPAAEMYSAEDKPDKVSIDQAIGRIRDAFLKAGVPDVESLLTRDGRGMVRIGVEPASISWDEALDDVRSALLRAAIAELSAARDRWLLGQSADST